MKILTAEEMRATDARTASEFGVPLRELMARAGEAVALFALSRFPDAARALAICGKGNNGGDGLVAARVLASQGVGVRVLLLTRAEELQGDAAWALDELKAAVDSGVVEELTSEQDMGRLLDDALDDADLILDAVVGTGFRPPLRGLAAAVRDRVNACPVPVIAVDVPSGWDADTTTQFSTGDIPPEHSEAFRANHVVTFTAPKPADVFGHLTPGHTFGEVVVAPIGSPAQAIASAQRLAWTGTAKRIAEQPRNVNSNKGKFGHVLIAAGSAGKAGAPSMASLACLRAGAGLVTAAVPRSILNTVALITPELMTAPLLEDEAGTAALGNLEPKRLETLLKRITVLAMGPGLSTDGDASAFARELAAKSTQPIVIDADGLNAFAGRAELLQGISGKGFRDELRTVVLTPHPGEMASLLGSSVKNVEADRLGLARRFATQYGVTLVLKGWRTLVAHPDGRVAVNTSGNPGMAKGGSGDVLTGIVAALLAQFPHRAAEAVECAVYLHGLAADLAVRGNEGDPGLDEHTLLATDLVAHLSDAFRYRAEDENGLVTVAGLRRIPLTAGPLA